MEAQSKIPPGPMMNAIAGLLLCLFCVLPAALRADEINDLKLEVQRLKERVTGLENEVPAVDRKSWGRGLSLGVPAGIFNEDPVVGLEFTYPLSYVLSLRLDAHLILDRAYRKDPYWRFLTKRALNIILFPSVGIVGKSPMVVNCRVYGGLFLGIAHDVKDKKDTWFQARLLGGVEIYTTRHQAFFLECGGGGTVTLRRIDYSQGIFFSGGSRFFF